MSIGTALDPNNPSGNIAVVACHPDDEAIGMGGTIKLLSQVNNVHVIFLTNGAGNVGNKQQDEYVSQRRQEARGVKAFLDISVTYFLDQDDGYLEYQKRPAIERLRQIFESVHPSLVFTHYRHDAHPDHAVAFDIVCRACWWSNRWNLKTGNTVSSIFEFEVLTPLLRYTELVDISSVVEEKKKAIALYKSQFIDANSILGLNRFRAALNTIPPFKGTHFEAFFETKFKLL